MRTKCYDWKQKRFGGKEGKETSEGFSFIFFEGVTDVDAYVFIEEVYVFIYENQFSSV